MTRAATPIRNPQRLRRIRPAPPAPPRRPGERIERDWPLLVAVAWIAYLAVVGMVQPPPEDPGALGTLENVLALLLSAGLFTTFAGLAGRYRFGLAASAVTGLVVLGAAVACPATGHHAIGAWWVAELAAAGLVVGASAAGYRRARRSG